MTKLIPIPQSVAKLTDTELGRQLVDQYGRACNGMVEYVAFGALAQNAKIRIDSTRGVDSPADGRGAKGTGFKAWLKEFTGEEINESTAYRYIDLAEIVREEMGAGARIDLYHVLKGDGLDPKQKKLRQRITEFVSGKSQRQLLIGAGKWESPSAHVARAQNESEADRHERLVTAARETAIAAFSAIDALGERWMLVKDAELQLAIENAEKFAKKAKAWLETPAPERARFKMEKILQEDAQ